MGFNFIIEYKRVRDNKVANALSRKWEGEEATLALISIHVAVWIDDLKQSYALSDGIYAIVSKLQKGEEASKGYVLQQGLLLRKGRLATVPQSPFKTNVLQYVHYNP